MIILAIDPGVVQTGLATIKDDRVIDARTIDATDVEKISALVSLYQPEYIVIEKPFVARNWDMFGLVSYMIGLAMGHVATTSNIDVSKIAFVSARTHTYILVGAKTRKQKQQKGMELWGTKIDSDHSACAAAIGIWYAQKLAKEIID
jgi:Holliday junction resolvasome RuvABC endonuclease subunit